MITWGWGKGTTLCYFCGSKIEFALNGSVIYRKDGQLMKQAGPYYCDSVCEKADGSGWF